MSDLQFQVRLQGNSGLPEDVYENVLFYFLTDNDLAEDTADDIAAAYDTFSHSGGWNSLEIRVYLLTGGQPIFQKTYPIQSASLNSGPHEVAVCLSYATVEDPAQSTPRRRGRIYIGPLSGDNLQTTRPGFTLTQSVLQLGQSLASAGGALGSTWEMYSRTDNVTAKIESIWVDNAWDTQRRRGLAPTARTVQDVQ